ncbi:MAG: MogA/MoaB family molybdenum cofactor biosynthesis protein [Propionibacteriaceae bacterium]|nr:MogA/MoaB family molybdenum cofactor biosynthesis protein [Propionibacteriaceae bacterium]
MRAAVITVSDEVASGADADRGGPVAFALLDDLGWQVTPAVVPDDPVAIRAAVREAIVAGARLVLACGGTGIGPRDHTPQAVRELLAFEIPGIAEEIRRRGLAHTPQALISREVAGVVSGTDHPPALLLAVPGSSGGVRDALAVVGDQLAYIIEQLDGAGHA